MCICIRTLTMLSKVRLSACPGDLVGINGDP